MAVQQLYPVYLLAGKDHRKIKKRVQQIEKLVFPDSQPGSNLNSITFFAEEVEPESIISECQTYPAFSEKKCIKVHDADKLDKKSLSKYLKNPSETAVLLLLSSKTEKEISKTLIDGVKTKGKLEFFNEKYANEAVEILSQKLRQKKIDFEPDFISFLVEQGENTVGNIEFIVETIASYYQKGNKLSASDIPNILASSKAPSIFDFIDSLFSQNTSKSIRLFHYMLVEEANFGTIVYFVFRQLKMIFEAKSLLEKRLSQINIAKNMKLQNFIVKKIISQASLFTFPHIEMLFYELAQLDFLLKSGEKSLSPTFFELFILRFSPSKK